VCHAVLASATAGFFDNVSLEQLPGAFESLWCSQITKEEESARHHPLEQHFGNADGWPFYQLKRALTYRSIMRVIEARRLALHGQSAAAVTQPAVERQYVGFGGRLRGRADHVIRRSGGLEIEDYKTGAIFEVAEDGPGSIKEAYQRQLLLYAALHWDNTGSWPTTASVTSLRGERATISVDPAEALCVVQETLALLDAYNSQVEAGASIEQLASASPHSCIHCPYKPMCEPFWDTIDSGWEMEGLAYVAGIVNTVDDFQATGRTLGMNITCGNALPGAWRLRNLMSGRFLDLGQVGNGAHIRIVGARFANKGTKHDLLPTDYTQLWWL